MEEDHVITLREAIGDLPSLEAGETSDIKWHNALKHNERQVEALRHTPEGKSAMKNEIYYPTPQRGKVPLKTRCTIPRKQMGLWSVASITLTTECIGMNQLRQGLLTIT